MSCQSKVIPINNARLSCQLSFQGKKINDEIIHACHRIKTAQYTVDQFKMILHRTRNRPGLINAYLLLRNKHSYAQFIQILAKFDKHLNRREITFTTARKASKFYFLAILCKPRWRFLCHFRNIYVSIKLDAFELFFLQNSSMKMRGWVLGSDRLRTNFYLSWCQPRSCLTSGACVVLGIWGCFPVEFHPLPFYIPPLALTSPYLHSKLEWVRTGWKIQSPGMSPSANCEKTLLFILLLTI